ncbi:MAG: family 1 glycosylhydrolase [Gemmatimonadetes bacterium]|nr:family 1 glycosylhydrolase [Gemmatimonadota bacterium]
MFALLLLALILTFSGCGRRTAPSISTFPSDFVFGTATAAYQVEGAYQADGKGMSIWDLYTNQFGIAGGATGNVAIDQYHRYAEDIVHLERLGAETYRFSLSWSRILPQGTGPVNQAGIDHYNRVIDALVQVGVEPTITLYHQDLPLALARQGGWANPESPEWFAAYARTVFEAFGDRVPTWITINEPYMESMYIGAIAKGLFAPSADQASVTDVPANVLVQQASEAHNLLLAHARAVQEFRSMNLAGQIGIALNLSPVYAATPVSADRDAALLEDGILNQWFIDPVMKGEYPADVLALYERDGETGLQRGSSILRDAAPPDFLGINYYAPVRVKASIASTRYGIEALPNPDSVQSYLGEVYPEGLSDLLGRLHRDYDSPRLFVTENGAGFGAIDDALTAGRVQDIHRQAYLCRHLAQVRNAIEAGVRVERYYVWAAFDHFEWTFGYSRRYGLIYVDFDTQERIWKDSAYLYRDIIATGRLDGRCHDPGLVDWTAQ